MIKQIIKALIMGTANGIALSIVGASIFEPIFYVAVTLLSVTQYFIYDKTN